MARQSATSWASLLELFGRKKQRDESPLFVCKVHVILLMQDALI
jgi:hypothetical protein